jgi:fructokinase
MVVQPVGATQRALVEREHQRSVISYDPNIRTNVEPDLDVWRATLQWMLPRTHLLKVSDEDLALSPDALRVLPDEFWAEVLGFAARAAAITCGRRGADLPRRADLP